MLRFIRAVCSHAEWFALVSHTVTGYFKTENKKDEVIFTYNPLYETKLTNVFYHLCLWWSSSLLHLKLVNQQYTEFMPIYPKKGTKTWGHFLMGGSTERVEMLLVVQCMLTLKLWIFVCHKLLLFHYKGHKCALGQKDDWRPEQRLHERQESR